MRLHHNYALTLLKIAHIDVSVLGQSLSSILTILPTCPNSDTLLCYSNDPFSTVSKAGAYSLVLCTSPSLLGGREHSSNSIAVNQRRGVGGSGREEQKPDVQVVPVQGADWGKLNVCMVKISYLAIQFLGQILGARPLAINKLYKKWLCSYYF